MRNGVPVLAGLGFLMIASAAAAQETQQQGDPFAQQETLDAATLAAEVVTQGSLTLGVSSQTLTAANSGNSVTGETITNGDINLGSDAFSGFNGIGNFVMNTGNNNNLQGSIGVVVIMPPATQ
jgi:hypothetical protein